MNRRRYLTTACFTAAALAGACLTLGCASHDDALSGDTAGPAPMDDTTTSDARANDAQPPERIRAWMDTLTVPHRYDPETGFIVAERVTDLPSVFVAGDDIRPALDAAFASGVTVIAVATADRCAPCQQYKLDALNDPRVIERLEGGDLIAVHIEVDRQPDLADELLGSRGIPMTYAIVDGKPAGVLRGQRPADDLLAFIGSATN